MLNRALLSDKQILVNALGDFSKSLANAVDSESEGSSILPFGKGILGLFTRRAQRVFVSDLLKKMIDDLIAQLSHKYGDEFGNEILFLIKRPTDQNYQKQKYDQIFTDKYLNVKINKDKTAFDITKATNTVNILDKMHYRLDESNRDNDKVEGWLIYAANCGMVYPVRLAISRGVDPNTKYSNGETILHNISSNGDGGRAPQIARFLIDNGADITIKNHDGNTAYDLAQCCITYRSKPDNVNIYRSSYWQSKLSSCKSRDRRAPYRELSAHCSHKFTKLLPLLNPNNAKKVSP